MPRINSGELMGSASAGGRIIGMFAVLFLIFMLIGWALGGYFGGDTVIGGYSLPGWVLGMLLFLIFAALINGIGYFLSDRIVLWAYRVKMVSESEAPRTYRIVKRVAAKANMRDEKGKKLIAPVVEMERKTQGNIIVPRVGIMPSNTPNAFATGRNPKKSVVVVSQGILDLLDDEELEGVIAHEISHIRNRDVLVMTVAATVAGAIAFAARWILWSTIFGSDNRNVNPLLLIVVAITAPLAALLVQLAISRSREYKADRTGALIIENPRALASALGKLESENRRKPLTFGNPASASLFIVNPFSGGKFVTIFSTHPPIQERIKKLRELEAEMKGQGPRSI
jgi:heat shock protein HtpX